ncbi:MAG: LytR C-terminal domain-containing protein [Nocardioidaceae bacterium]
MGRRQITTAVTMVLLIGILGLGIVVGYKSLFEPLPGVSSSSADPKPHCTVQRKGQQIRTAEVEVSVFNRGSRVGLAGETLHKLGKLGFRKGEVGNAPSGVKVKNLQVWSTVKHDAAAKLVALQFGRNIKVHVKKRSLGPGIDVIVGNGYRGLVPAPKAVRVRTPTQVCVTPTPSPASGF